MDKSVLAKLAGAAAGGFITTFLTAWFSGMPAKAAASAGAAAAATTAFGLRAQSPGTLLQK